MTSSTWLACPYRNYELGFVFAIDHELVREAKQRGATASELLEWAIEPLRGALKAHLVRHPRHCLEQMAKVLKERMSVVKCPDWKTAVDIALRTVTYSLHMEHCQYCKKDQRLARSGLPNYGEFYLASEPKN